MQVQPLHYPQRADQQSFEISPVYGQGRYHSHDGCFRFVKVDSRWEVTALGRLLLVDVDLEQSFFDHGPKGGFRRLRDAVVAVETFLKAEGIQCQ